MHTFSVRWVIANWPAVRDGSVHRAKSHREQVTESHEQRTYFNSTTTRNWCCLKEKCSRSKSNNYVLIHNKHLDLKTIPELGGNTWLRTPAQPKADRPQSMGWTRITYCVLCLLLTLPKGFPEHIKRTAGVWPPGPRLCPRSDLWEPKPEPLVRPISLALLSSSWPHCRSCFLSNFSILFEIKKIFQGFILPPDHAGAFQPGSLSNSKARFSSENAYAPIWHPKNYKVFGKHIEERFYPWVQAVGKNKTSYLLHTSALRRQAS